jgi:hypothetical protein
MLFPVCLTCTSHSQPCSGCSDSFGITCTLDYIPAMFRAKQPLHHHTVYMQPNESNLSDCLSYYAQQRAQSNTVGALLVVPATCTVAQHPELAQFERVHQFRQHASNVRTDSVTSKHTTLCKSNDLSPRRGYAEQTRTRQQCL